MAKLTYNGPEGFSVAGLTLEPGEEVELSDEQAEELAEHPWFGGGEKKSSRSKKKEASDEPD
jgi:hypothetical protein